MSVQDSIGSETAVEDAASDATNIGNGSILLIDDSALNLTALETALEPLGRRLVRANSGSEALGFLLEQDFILIILDVSMPGMDGFETAQLIRARPRSSETPIIFLTAREWTVELALQGYRLGGVEFLTKPVHDEVLRAKAAVFVALEERTAEARRQAEELRAAHARELERELTLQRKRFEADLAAAQLADLTKTNQRKDTFLAILGHELRNPLQPLHSALETIGCHPTDPVPERTLSIMRARLAHIEKLVDDLLDVARLNTDKVRLAQEAVCLADVVEQAVVNIRRAADERGYSFSITVDPAAVVYGDQVRLIQIVTNLLDNALKYGEPASVITVRVEVDGGHVFVRVSDTGKGIDATMLDRIFDMFVQDRVATNGYGGLGLGLALVKKLVALHGGTVCARSAGFGQGSTFEVRLPRLEATIAAAKPAATSPVTTTRLRAVVVDDQEDARDLLAELLEHHGHQVRTYADGRAAIDGIVDDPPDFALIDIGLPEIDGYEVARILRSKMLDHAPKLIAMTGYGQVKDREDALAAGFDEHIVKPASYAKIEGTLHVGGHA